MSDIDTIVPILNEAEPEVVVTPVPEVEDREIKLRQSRLNEILKDAQSRAGRSSREEAARLTIENQRLREVAAGQGSPDETERIRGELASARLEADALREQQVASQRDLLIAAQAEAFIDLDTVQKLTRGNLKHTSTGFIVVNDDGSPRLNADNTPTSVTEFFSDFANKKPWLARGVVKSGSGSVPSTHRLPATDRHAPETLWGPRARPDAGRILNELALRDKSAYDAARRIAVQRGLI